MPKYAITITLHPKMYTVRPTTQYKRSVNILNKLIFDKSIDLEYLYPELTPANNVHYHGVIIMADTNFYYANYKIHEWFRGIPTFGFICVKELKDESGWLTYCTKQQDTIKDLLLKGVYAKPYTQETKVEMACDMVDLEFNMEVAATVEREAYLKKRVKPDELDEKEE